MFSSLGGTCSRVRGGHAATVLTTVALLATALLLAGCGGSHADTSASISVGSGPIYLALGDSLADGIQPNAKGQQLPSGKGYVNDVYAHLKAQLPKLQLVDLSCPGDSTTSLLTGKGNAVAAKLYRCDRSGGSQLQAALSFIRAHRSQVKLISIDISANDVIPCVSPAVFDKGAAALASCIGTGEAAIAANLPKILAPLKSAAAPGTALVGGTVYDPFLTGVLDPNKTVKEVSVGSLSMITKVDQEISAADGAAGFKTADVADAFSYNVATEVRSARLKTKVPKAVAVLCEFTYMCAGTPQGPNIHPTTAGYSAMAGAYDRQLGSL